MIFFFDLVHCEIQMNPKVFCDWIIFSEGWFRLVDLASTLRVINFHWVGGRWCAASRAKKFYSHLRLESTHTLTFKCKVGMSDEEKKRVVGEGWDGEGRERENKRAGWRRGPFLLASLKRHLHALDEARQGARGNLYTHTQVTTEPDFGFESISGVDN